MMWRRNYMEHMFQSQQSGKLARMAVLRDRLEGDLAERETRLHGMLGRAREEALAVKWDIICARVRSERIKEEHEEAKRAVADTRRRIDVLNAEVTHAEDTLERYVAYQEFIEGLMPTGVTLDRFLEDQKNLSREIVRLAKQNLFIMDRCRMLGEIVERRNFVDAEMIEAMRSDLSVEARGAGGPDAMRVRTPVVQSEAPPPHQDNETAELSAAIMQLHIDVLGPPRNLLIDVILEDLERELVALFDQIDRFDWQVVERRRQALEHRKRDRLLRQRDRDRDAARKQRTEEAVRRAKLPPPEKTGRPLVPPAPLCGRHPGEVHHRTDERMFQLEREFLFGEADWLTGGANAA